MQGAREYAATFMSGQHGRLCIISGRHARGKTFHIYVLPEGEVAKFNGEGNPPLTNGTVEVYGVVGGQRGWTEQYGWLHEGKWKDDFMLLYNQKKEEAEKFLRAALIRKEQQILKEKQRQLDLLSQY
jgi:hypothetical protein